MTSVSHIRVDISASDDNYNLVGFSSRINNAPFLGNDKLNLDILIVRLDNCEFALVIADTLYFPSELAVYISDLLEQRCRLNSEHIIFSATHTHSAPNISWDFAGSIDREYFSMIKFKLNEALLGTVSCIEGDLYFEKYVDPRPYSNNVIGRRRYVRDIRPPFPKKSLLLPNKNAKVDSDIRVLRFSPFDGSSDIIIFNLSCHPVFNSSMRPSSDFCGKVCELLEKDGNQQAIFLQGFCGDIRPNSTTRSLSLRSLASFVKSLSYKEVFVEPSSSFFNIFTQDIVTTLEERAPVSKKLTNVKISQSDFEFYSDSGDTRLVRKIKFMLLNDVVVISIPAEVLSGYVLMLEKEFVDLSFIPMGYAEGMIGYLPHPSDFPSGGYEIESYSNYGWDSSISLQCLLSFESFLVEHVHALIN